MTNGNKKGFSSNMQCSCVVPITGPRSVNPNWVYNSCQVFTNLVHNWFTSPKIPKGPYLQEKDMPVDCHVAMTAIKSLEQNWKKVVDAAADYAVPSTKMVKPNHGGQLFKTDSDVVKHEKTANCSRLRKRIPGLKCVNSEVKSVDTLPLIFPSNGSMAPCRSHHGKHTRQEMILQWISREPNPIHATMQNQTRPRTRLDQYIYIYNVTTSYGCNLMGCHPGASRRYVYTGPGGCLHWPPTPRDPGDPLHKY